MGIGSNEQMFVIENRPPSADKAQFIELEYVSNKGHSYEGHPQYLLSESEAKIYRSQANKFFDYLENDFIVFKLKHSGFSRQYLPKAIVVRNFAGTQAVKTMIVSIGSTNYGEARGAQCRFKVKEFKLYGLEFQ